MIKNINHSLIKWGNIIKYYIDFYKFYKNQQLSVTQKAFAGHLAYFKVKKENSNSKDILLVQLVKNYEFTLKFAAASKALSDAKRLKICFYEVEIDWERKKSRHKKIYDYLFKNGLEKIHNSFGNNIVFRNSEKYHDQKFIEDKLHEIIAEISDNNIEKLLALRFDDILVGDLIYDTYLRFFHKPTLIKIDENVMLVVEFALNLFYNFKFFLKSVNVRCLLNSYATGYIHHGITARVCLSNNISVFTIGSSAYVIQKLSSEFPTHLLNYSLFDPDKKLSNDQLSLAKRMLTSRFKGEIDIGTSYMKKSAYSEEPINADLKKRFEKNKRNIIIYAHDFYDAPHLNRKLQFPDFYQYLNETLDALKNLEGTSVFIKVHPGGIKGCAEMTMELVDSFNKNHFHILNEKVSNLHIVELKPDLICTARGTIGIEMAYFGIPTVALYDNPYVNFRFVHTCMNKESYFSILCGNEKPVIDFSKDKIYSFYFQFFLEKAILEEGNVFNLLHSFKGNTYCDDYLRFILSNSRDIFCDKFLDYYRVKIETD